MKALLFCIFGLGVVINIGWAAADKHDIVMVPAGGFQMGCSMTDVDCVGDEGAPGGINVEVPAFRLDRHEVTVKAYMRCVEAGGCSKPEDTKRNFYCNYDNPARAEHPVNCIDWQQALTYCETQGGRLPYEAEWEKAARAGSLSRYPWGHVVSCKQAILDDGKTQGSVPNEPDGCGEDRTWPVGSRSPNALGLYDMHGNAGEWVMNWYAQKALKDLYAKGDLKGPTKGRKRVVRGGSWDETRKNLRSSYRNLKFPVSGRAIYGSIGFRCAY